jgi:nicotinamidase-related amidase
MFDKKLLRHVGDSTSARSRRCPTKSSKCASLTAYNSGNVTESRSKIRSLLIQARAARVPIIYIQHCGSEGAIDHPDTPGWKIHPAIAPVDSDIIVQKRHPDAFQDTCLQRELESRGIKELIITGIQTEYCVDTTCRCAYSLNYDVTLIKDAHSTWDTDLLSASQIIAHHNEVLGGWFAKLREASEVKFDSAA